MEAILTLQTLNSAEFYVAFSCIDSFAFDEIKWQCAFAKHIIEKITRKQQSVSIS